MLSYTYGSNVLWKMSKRHISGNMIKWHGWEDCNFILDLEFNSWVAWYLGIHCP